ncbi:MAG: gephyrin-like molybdotransferase Glp [Halococcoides sp.]
MDDEGFRSVTPLETARDRLQSVCEPHGRTETIALSAASGRVLAEAVTASRPVPHYERAAMDGYAVRAADTRGASARSPVELSVGEKAGPETAVQVHTGSPVPEGADAVVMVEQTERRDTGLLVRDALAPGENVAAVGEDVAAGDRLVAPNDRLAPSDCALLRATGVERVRVRDPPRVAVIPTGEELVQPDRDPDPGQVVETNGLQVSALVDQWGGTPTHRDIVTDDADRLRAAIERDLDHDIVVTTGGSSVGERDLLPDVIEDCGELLVHGVAIKPGHPVGFGVVEGTPILLLPGYPVSTQVTAVQLLRPAIAWLTGTDPPALPTRRGRLGRKVRSTPGERTFARVVLDDDDPPTVEPIRTGGAGVLSSITNADGWVEVPESREGIPAGETVAVQCWENPCE